MANITDEGISKFLPRNTRYKRGVGKGLCLLIRPDGGKSWALRYRVNKKEQLICFGTYPEVSIEKAWEKAMEAREQLRNGILPNELRKTLKQSVAYKHQIINTVTSCKPELEILNKVKRQLLDAERFIRLNPNSDDNLRLLEQFINEIKKNDILK